MTIIIFYYCPSPWFCPHLPTICFLQNNIRWCVNIQTQVQFYTFYLYPLYRLLSFSSLYFRSIQQYFSYHSIEQHQAHFVIFTIFFSICSTSVLWLILPSSLLLDLKVTSKCFHFFNVPTSPHSHLYTYVIRFLVIFVVFRFSLCS